MPTVPPQAPARPRALIIDDDAMVLRIAERALRELGVDVFTSTRSFGLLNRIAEIRPKLVLLDVRMPGLDGPSLVQLVRADPELASTTVLLYSAMEADELAAAAKSCGADGYLPKSLGITQIAKAVDIWMSR